MSTDYKALCAELLSLLDGLAMRDPEMDGGLLRRRARAALAQPEPVGPTQGEAVAVYTEVMLVHDCQTLGDMAEHFVRAVLARWGNYPVKPDSSPANTTPEAP